MNHVKYPCFYSYTESKRVKDRGSFFLFYKNLKYPAFSVCIFRWINIYRLTPPHTIIFPVRISYCFFFFSYCFSIIYSPQRKQWVVRQSQVRNPESIAWQMRISWGSPDQLFPLFYRDNHFLHFSEY